jgi:hypothetical protein
MVGGVEFKVKCMVCHGEYDAENGYCMMCPDGRQFNCCNTLECIIAFDVVCELFTGIESPTLREMRQIRAEGTLTDSNGVGQ